MLKQYEKIIDKQNDHIKTVKITKKSSKLKYVDYLVIAGIAIAGAILCICVYNFFAGQTEPQYYYSIAVPQKTDKDPYLVKWPLTGNIFSLSTVSILQTSDVTFTLEPGYTYRIIAGVGSNKARDAGGCIFYILANNVQIGNTGSMIATNNGDTWASSPTCLAYIAPLIITDISFAISNNIGQSLGAYGDARASAWISIELIW
jgi:hypothetical protein